MTQEILHLGLVRVPEPPRDVAVTPKVAGSPLIGGIPLEGTPVQSGPFAEIREGGRLAKEFDFLHDVIGRRQGRLFVPRQRHEGSTALGMRCL